ncbi:winged helix-turn-helix domain-containing protein [Campylobacter sp. MOP51]|uniref:winged helix-turn-helix domain-containing protein n=1 Tax=Campylobacter canis TaxID=3378588 RepID=UPI003C3C9A0E
MVPSHKEMMLPILRFLSTKSEADRKEIYEFVAKYFKLSDDEKELKIPSGKVLLYVSRASWALSYLASIQEVMNLPKNKRPASKIGRGTFKITEFGVIRTLRLNLALGMTRFITKPKVVNIISRYPQTNKIQKI